MEWRDGLGVVGVILGSFGFLMALPSLWRRFK